MPSLTNSPAWRALLEHRDALGRERTDNMWREDLQRGEAFTFGCAGLAVDLSKQRATRATLGLLVALARERGLPHAIERLFTGDHINISEDRPALHTALRGDEHVTVDGHDVLPEVQRHRERMRVFAQAVREGQWKGATGKRFTHVLAIGIGGSALGPRLAIEALRDAADGPQVRFVANVDPAELDDATRGLDAASTLVIVASKTFTTQETMANAVAARAWLADTLGPDAPAKHIIAATANEDAAVEWGLPDCNIFPLEEWVGGRYSVWSSVGLPVAIALGMPAFDRLLAGAHAVDLEFRSKALEHNAPALLGLFGVWNRNFLGAASHAVLSYASRLESLPAYLQQLEMESNGKHVAQDGSALDFSTCPVIWGGTETPGQHAFHQWLHQGTDAVSCDFIVAAHPMGTLRSHHEMLIANACAQSQALMTGVSTPQAWRECQGDRPSTTIVLPELDAFHLGALLALYEHKVFVEGTVWGINSFDQWGVELGKTIAGQVLPAVRGKPANLHPATAHLLEIIRRMGESG